MLLLVMARILVIEDDPGMRLMLGEVLKRPGFDVVLAANGREGVELARARPADVVITDLFMPEKEGLETIKEIHQDSPQAAIIAISGKPGAPALLAVAQRFGASRVVQKPFTPEEILTVVEETVGRREAQ